jgi:hypothetical protein
VNQNFSSDHLRLLQVLWRELHETVFSTATVLSPLTVQEFLAKSRMTHVHYTPFSTDWAPYDVFIFTELKFATEGTEV